MKQNSASKLPNTPATTSRLIAAQNTRQQCASMAFADNVLRKGRVGSHVQAPYCNRLVRLVGQLDI